MMGDADAGIGTKLRDARVGRDLSIEESAWRTRIRPETLRALECEEFEILGHDAFVRSHLLSYARFLGIDPTDIVGEFERRAEPSPSPIEELNRQERDAKKPPRAKWWIAAAFSGALLAAAAVVGVLGGQGERPAASSSALPSAPPAVTSPSPDGLVPPAEARVRLAVEVVSDTTMSVSADGAQVFEGTLEAGTTRTFRARRTLEVVVADAGAVRFTHNGDELGPPGEAGTVVRARDGPRGRRDA